MNIINSKEYWDDRFKGDSWEANYGKEQTQYFANILLSYLPKEIFEDIHSILDWGCALGQLCNQWKKKNKNCLMQGYDLSEEAINKARFLYPDIIFSYKKPILSFDAVVCSNVLEHLFNWKETLAELKTYSNKYVIILVPFETGIGGEHVINFREDDFIDDDIIFKQIIQCNHPYYWPGNQLMIIYKKEKRE